jgi:sorbitol-specific phosphotransferase system component IIC
MAIIMISGGDDLIIGPINISLLFLMFTLTQLVADQLTIRLATGCTRVTLDMTVSLNVISSMILKVEAKDSTNQAKRPNRGLMKAKQRIWSQQH